MKVSVIWRWFEMVDSLESPPHAVSSSIVNRPPVCNMTLSTSGLYTLPQQTWGEREADGDDRKKDDSLTGRDPPSLAKAKRCVIRDGKTHNTTQQPPLER